MTTASGLAQEFRILLPPKLSKNSTSSVYSRLYGSSSLFLQEMEIDSILISVFCHLEAKWEMQDVRKIWVFFGVYHVIPKYCQNPSLLII